MLIDLKIELSAVSLKVRKNLVHWINKIPSLSQI